MCQRVNLAVLFWAVVFLAGCGLHGTRAEFLGIENGAYLFKDWEGRELRLVPDKNLRKEPDLKKGDQVQLYYTEDEVVQFITKP